MTMLKIVNIEDQTKSVSEDLRPIWGVNPGGLVQFDGESDPPSNGINTR